MLPFLPPIVVWQKSSGKYYSITILFKFEIKPRILADEIRGGTMDDTRGGTFADGAEDGTLVDDVECGTLADEVVVHWLMMNCFIDIVNRTLS